MCLIAARLLLYFVAAIADLACLILTRLLLFFVAAIANLALEATISAFELIFDDTAFLQDGSSDCDNFRYVKLLSDPGIGYGEGVRFLDHLLFWHFVSFFGLSGYFLLLKMIFQTSVPLAWYTSRS